MIDERSLLPIGAEKTFAEAEKLWKSPDARGEIRRLFEQEYRSFDSCVVALDDDPTGVQTVHDIDVVTAWEGPLLEEMLAPKNRLFFVLTNSRSFSSERTQRVHEEIAADLSLASRRTGRPVLLVSRSDSTLRGHFPLETETLRRVMQENGHPPFAGEVLCPFFREGGRFTLNGVHYVQEGEWLVPAARTEFAADRTFGYHYSRIADYIEEKTGGRTSAEQVIEVTLRELRGLCWQEMEQKLMRAEGFRYIVADALEEADVQALAIVLMRLMKRGFPYIFRSAAAVPKVWGHVQDRPLLGREEMLERSAEGGGLVVVGSHVRKSTEQLECLAASGLPLEMIEFRVDGWQLEETLEQESLRVRTRAEQAMAAGRTAVVYTSRELVAPEGATPEEMLRISVRIADAVTRIVQELSFRPRFLIAKGGITSSEIGVKALGVRRALVAGQAAPGIPVWKTGPESRFPGLSYIIFPGNVGSRETLRDIVEKLV